MLIAPLNANTLAKIAKGMCDNLVTCVVRAWDRKKPLYFAPAMNTYMWDNPITFNQEETLRGLLGYKEIPCIEKELMCGDKGYGAMTTVATIGEVISGEVKNHFAGKIPRPSSTPPTPARARLPSGNADTWRNEMLAMAEKQGDRPQQYTLPMPAKQRQPEGSSKKQDMSPPSENPASDESDRKLPTRWWTPEW